MWINRWVSNLDDAADLGDGHAVEIPVAGTRYCWRFARPPFFRVCLE